MIATSEGVRSSQTVGEAEHARGAEISYNFELEPGYENLQVFLDTTRVTSSGTVTMDADHILTGLADKKVSLTPGDEALVSSLRALLQTEPMVAYREIQARVSDLFEGVNDEEALRRLIIAQTVAYDGVRDAAALRRAMAEVGESLSAESSSSRAQILPQFEPSQRSQSVSPLVSFIYVNGVHTQPPEFEATLEVLNTVLTEAGYNDRAAYPLLRSYNRSSAEHDVGALETWTCLELKAQEASLGRYSATRAVLSCLFAPGSVNSILESVVDIGNIILGSPPDLESVDVLRLTALMRERLVAGERVVVVAHSQGNLILSQALANLARGRPSIEFRCVGAVSIAPPVEVTAAPGQQAVTGMIIQGTYARDILLQIPLGNLLVPKVRNSLSDEFDRREARLLLSPFGLLGVRILNGYALHSIDNSYLGQKTTREQVRTALQQQVQTVMRECPVAPPPPPPPSTTTTIITSDHPDPSEVDQAVAVSFTVTAEGGTPTGSVTVTASGGSESCSGSLSSGLGSCLLILTNEGSRTLTATYGGNNAFAGSVDTEAHAVQGGPGGPSASTSTVAASPTTITAGSGTSTITVTVKEASGNLLGAIQVSVSATGSGNTIDPATATSDASGVATFTFSSAVAETKTITAIAGGVTLDQHPVITVQDVQPPPQGEIAFTRDGGDIYSVMTDASAYNPLVATTEAGEADPAWLADGTKLAFSRGFPSFPEGIYVLDVGTRETTCATCRVFDHDLRDPAWVPDGRVSYSVVGVDIIDGIYVTTPGGSDRVKLIPNSVYSDVGYDPAWSLLGRMAFHGLSDIFVLELNGFVTNLTLPFRTQLLISNAESPAWSPDGSRLAFSVILSSTHETTIATMNADGSGGLDPLSLPGVVGANDPSWSPDGTMLAFDAKIAGATQCAGNSGLQCSDIFIVSRGGGTPQNLTNTPSIDETKPAWRP